MQEKRAIASPTRSPPKPKPSLKTNLHQSTRPKVTVKTPLVPSLTDLAVDPKSRATTIPATRNREKKKESGCQLHYTALCPNTPIHLTSHSVPNHPPRYPLWIRVPHSRMSVQHSLMVMTIRSISSGRLWTPNPIPSRPSLKRESSGIWPVTTSHLNLPRQRPRL